MLPQDGHRVGNTQEENKKKTEILSKQLLETDLELFLKNQSKKIKELIQRDTKATTWFSRSNRKKIKTPKLPKLNLRCLEKEKKQMH